MSKLLYRSPALEGLGGTKIAFARVWLTILGRIWVDQAIFGEEWRSKGAGRALFVRLEGVVNPHHFFDACEMTWWCQKWISRGLCIRSQLMNYGEVSFSKSASGSG